MPLSPPPLTVPRADAAFTRRSQGAPDRRRPTCARSLRRRGSRSGLSTVINGLAVRGDLALARKLAAHGEVARIVGDPVVHGSHQDLLAPAPASSRRRPGAGRPPDRGRQSLEPGREARRGDRGRFGRHGRRVDAPGVEGQVPRLERRDGQAMTSTGSTRSKTRSSRSTTTTTARTPPARWWATTALGNQIGVAPGARWIACRNMNFGDGQPSTYIACNQFFLAPFPMEAIPKRTAIRRRRPTS